MEALVEGSGAATVRCGSPTHQHQHYHDDDDGKPARTPPPSTLHLLLTQLGWAALVVGAVAGYLALALNGGVVELVRMLDRWGGPRDIYAHAPAHGRAYGLHPFQEMFWPQYVQTSNRRSLAVFTAGRDGLPNVDRLVRQWGHDHFDYLICHFDESQAEWAALPWYKRAVGFYAHRQGKMFFFKRALTPYLVQEYEYVHFIDSDAGSPVPANATTTDDADATTTTGDATITDNATAGPFSLWAYERVLRAHRVVMGQPAVTNKAKTSAHPICRQEPDLLLRWTTFVENGPLFSLHVPSGGFASVWEMVDPLSVSGYGVDLAWCSYLYEQKGFDRSRTCAVVDAHPIDHLDTHSATSQVFNAEGEEGRELDYYTWGRIEWRRYARLVGRGLQDWKRLDVLRRVPLDDGGRVLERRVGVVGRGEEGGEGEGR